MCRRRLTTIRRMPSSAFLLLYLKTFSREQKNGSQFPPTKETKQTVCVCVCDFAIIAIAGAHISREALVRFSIHLCGFREKKKSKSIEWERVFSAGN